MEHPGPTGFSLPGNINQPSPKTTMKTNRLSRSLLAGGLLLLALAGGCATKREVTVDSLAEPGFRDQKQLSYTIRAKVRGNQSGSELRDQEAVAHIKTALSAQGMWEAPNAEEADLVIEVEYGMDNPRVRFDVVQAPVYSGVVPEEAVRQYPAANAPEITGGGGLTVGRLRGVDHSMVTVPVTIREKHLTVSGRENRPAVEGRPPPEVFRVSASIEDESEDLRGSLPVLAAAAMDKIGQPTEGEATATIREDSEAVIFIRRGM